MNRDQALVDALLLQRNEALNKLADANADLAVARARIAELESATERLKALEEKIAKIEGRAQETVAA